jgi:hypothetical protein
VGDFCVCTSQPASKDEGEGIRKHRKGWEGMGCRTDEREKEEGREGASQGEREKKL